MTTVNLWIDGKNVTARQGMTVMEAAEEAGIRIPHLCYHPLLEKTGACRLCVVEIEGARALQSSCTVPVAEGMRVHTMTQRVINARKTVLELLLANHPTECLTCEKAGDCALQDYAYEYNVRSDVYPGKKKEYPLEDNNPFFTRDHNKCIVCGRCIRMCADIQGQYAIDYAYRGFSTRVLTAYDESLVDSPCVFCGNCISVCPVGALTPKWERGKGRKWQYEKVRSVCPYCGVGCQIYLHVKDSKVIGVSAADGPANRGLLCVKGRFGQDFLEHPDRLTKPLIRVDGRFVEAEWEEALSLVAEKLSAIRDKYGPDALGFLSSAKVTNEENYLMQKLARAVFGTNNVDHCARLCHASSVAGLAASFGSGAMTNSIEEIENADVIFVIGSNTKEAHPVIGTYITRAISKGARLIVADPRKTDLAACADVHLQHLPGSDVALLNAMMHVILRDRLHNEDFIRNRTEGFTELKEMLEEYSPEVAEGITGVPADKMEIAARIFATAKKGTILYSMGITQHTTGTDNVMSIANLAMLTGHIGRESTGVNPLRGQNNVQGACDMGALPNVFPGYQRVDDPTARGKFEKAWGRALPDKVGLTVVEMMNAARAGQIRGMFIMGENPMVSDPDISHVKESLEQLEFLVVLDIFPTETAQLAHVVLPAAAYAEKEGTFTNTERRVQRIYRAVPPPGQARPDWLVLCQIAKAAGYEMDYDSPADILAEVATLTPSYGGISYERLDGEGLQWPCPDPGHPGTRYLHKDKFTRGLGRFYPVAFKEPAEWPDKDYPLILSTGRVLYHYHTGSMSRRARALDELVPGGYVEIHPKTAEALGIADGQMVRVETRRGWVDTKARVTDTVSQRVIFMPFHFAEAAANVLTNPALDPVAKIPELKVCAARVTLAGKGDAQ